MKVIEAMKKVKSNKQKISDLQQLIVQHCAHLSHETPVYGDDTKNKVNGWVQSCEDLSQENVKLLCQIQFTNLNTKVDIEVDEGKKVTKSVAAWVWRRREYARLDASIWAQLGDRGLKEGEMRVSTGDPIQVKIVRNFDPNMRDKKLSMYKHEPSMIDGILETVNATTDLLDLP